MAETLEDARREARGDAAADGFVQLAERLGGDAGADAVFGTPVERDGVTVIPVAGVRWGFGSGRGRRKGEGDESSGGGGGVQAAPLGFIELHDGTAQYRRIRDPLRLAVAALLMPLSCALAAMMVLLTLAAFARAMKGMVRFPELPWPFRARA